MIIYDSLKKFGDYVLLMRRVFTIPDRWREFFKRYISEIYKLGIDSIPIVITISVFIGAVIAIQMQKNVVSPLIPAYAVGLATRDVILLEFSSSILCLILAGKVGSNIASEIGTMRVTEQIDALEIMGVSHRRVYQHYLGPEIYIRASKFLQRVLHLASYLQSALFCICHQQCFVVLWL